MTRKEVAESIHKMRQYGKKASSSKESAIDALKKAGILTKSGDVAEPYKKLLSSTS